MTKICIIITAILSFTTYLNASTSSFSFYLNSSVHSGETSPDNSIPDKTTRGGISKRLRSSSSPIEADNTGRFSPKAFKRIKISADGRRLAYEDGSPFFYLGDTAWELFHRLNREEADHYLENRARKGFTVIQAVALAEQDGLNTPNPYGHRPLHNNNPATPNNAYFEHVDYIVNKAESLGMYMGMLPTWGDKIEKKAHGIGPVVFTPENARSYGAWIAERYKNKPIIWILGGDRAMENETHYAIIRAMAAGIRSVVGDSQLITFHPAGSRTGKDYEVERGSSTYFHHDSWLDFNMFQSGHYHYNIANYKWIAHDRSLQPVRPTLDAEPRYEDHPVNWNPLLGYFTDYDVRQAAYWALTAGACGHTYGDHNIWQMWHPGRVGISHPRTHWKQALNHAGSSQMGYMKDLFLSRPWFDLNPDQSLIAAENEHGSNYIVAAKGKDYAVFYLPTGKDLTVNLGKFSGDEVKGWWFNPRNKEVTSIGTFPNEGTKSFDAPGSTGRGNDWVLVLDDASRNYPAPGQGKVVAEQPPSQPVPAPQIPAQPKQAFYRAINLNGPALTIDGNSWEGSNAANYSYSGFSFTDHQVNLNPATDESRTAMIRSSVFSKELKVTLSSVPAGKYDVYLYVWEDNNNQLFNLFLEGKLVKQNHQSGSAGTWSKLGPYSVNPTDGTIVVTTSGGNANLSGIEVWKSGSKPDPIVTTPDDDEDDDDEDNDDADEQSPAKGFSGYYRLVARHSGKALEVKNGSTATGANVHQWEANGSSNQIWQITSTGNGYYKLLARHSGKALDVSGASSQNGANVQQWDDNGSHAQEWNIEPVGNGYYKLIARCSNKALDIIYSSDHDGADAIQWNYNGEAHQHWKLEKVSASDRKIASQLEESETVSLYPNPASSQVTLVLMRNKEENTRIVISNVTGVEFYNGMHTLKPGENQVVILVSQLPAGAYFINIGGKLSEKLLISR